MKRSTKALATLATWSIALPALAATVPFAPFAQEPFTDVREADTSYTAVEQLRKDNIVKGYPDGTFKADNRINRAEFVYLITNPFLLDTEALNECLGDREEREDDDVFYPDVPVDEWYAPAVCHATEKDIIDGYPDGRFRPTGQINFAEASKILANVFALNVTEEPGERWFNPYVEMLDELNAIPTTINRYDQTMTRGEMAEILYRLKYDKTNLPSKSMGSIKF